MRSVPVTVYAVTSLLPAPTMAAAATGDAAPAALAQIYLLAHRLTLPLTSPDDIRYPLLLVATRQRLELWFYDRAKEVAPKPPRPVPVFVDFVTGRAGYRRAHGGGRSQLIAKAVGLKRGLCPTVIDATAGFGRDSLVLATLGCQVTMLERSPIIAALLADGLRRAVADTELSRWLPARLCLHETDAQQWFDLNNAAYAQQNARNSGDAADVIYLDPMYPARDKTALVKKEQRALQALAGADLDAAGLLDVALSHARRRVVVKRPRLAPLLTQTAPSAQVTGKTTRYDIYLI